MAATMTAGIHPANYRTIRQPLGAPVARYALGQYQCTNRRHRAPWWTPYGPTFRRMLRICLRAETRVLNWRPSPRAPEDQDEADDAVHLGEPLDLEAGVHVVDVLHLKIRMIMVVLMIRVVL